MAETMEEDTTRAMDICSRSTIVSSHVRVSLTPSIPRALEAGYKAISEQKQTGQNINQHTSIGVDVISVTYQSVTLKSWDLNHALLGVEDISM